MGQEIARAGFRPEDFARFRGRLEHETTLLSRWLEEGRFEQSRYVAGFELEAWLLDHNFFPNPINQAFLARVANPLVVPELSTFNIELNGSPQALRGRALRVLEAELTATWQQCLKVAHELESTLVMIGTLPTLREADLSLAHISPLNRYYALNDQVFTRREGRPIRIHIRGREEIDLTHSDVMLEAGTTSFQVHIQVPADEMVRTFNASLILSAPMVAMAANAPFLFGKSLWDETRIPLFEQAVEISDDLSAEDRRVTFGSGYLRESPMECYRENLNRHPVLLPLCFDDGAAQLQHLRLHNGTIWRWNRPLIGFDATGAPHFRIEHRVMPAGPSIVDMIANAALYLGAVRFLAGLAVPPELDLPFEQARENFYAAAQDGFDAKIVWLGGVTRDVRSLLEDEIIPMAREGLLLLGVDEDDRERYLRIIHRRVRTAWNGAAWQRAHAERYGRDFFRLTADYLEHQRSGMPVHEWDV